MMWLEALLSSLLLLSAAYLLSFSAPNPQQIPQFHSLQKLHDLSLLVGDAVNSASNPDKNALIASLQAQLDTATSNTPNCISVEIELQGSAEYVSSCSGSWGRGQILQGKNQASVFGISYFWGSPAPFFIRQWTNPFR